MYIERNEVQPEANKATGYLTDGELNFLWDFRDFPAARDPLLIRAINELRERRTVEKKRVLALFDHSVRMTKHFEPLLGYCACNHCAQLPATAPQKAP
jgi:hypothetical protein